jgi:hypothetical protein
MFSAVYQVIGMKCFKFPVSTSRSFCASMPDGALYGSLILYVSPASVHHTVVNACKDTAKFKSRSSRAVFGI